jgi:hypothetical protein
MDGKKKRHGVDYCLRSLIVCASRLMNWSAVGPEEQIAAVYVESIA